mmetsp:Transcript_2517/g.5775  ORF Transcript_2517/g.5775 Transcript_2517/m.5775 type:complete len:91 (+) Transcript_2517:161-433(+)
MVLRSYRVQRAVRPRKNSISLHNVLQVTASVASEDISFGNDSPGFFHRPLKSSPCIECFQPRKPTIPNAERLRVSRKDGEVTELKDNTLT